MRNDDAKLADELSRGIEEVYEILMNIMDALSCSKYIQCLLGEPQRAHNLEPKKKLGPHKHLF